MNDQQMSILHPYMNFAVDLICWPKRRSHKPARNWKKSQKKIRRERWQRGGKK